MGELKTCPECGVAIAEGDSHCPRCMLRAGLGEESRMGGQGHAFEGDRNLLFGVFAVQLRKVTPQEVMAAAGAWAADASKDLPTRLREQGVLTETDVEFIARLVDEAVRAHDGDVEATLNTLGGAQVLQATFGNSIDLSRHHYGAAGSPVYLDGTIDPDSVPGVQETPGRYTHVSEHARGGMGRVLLVHDGFLGRNVALKELMPGQRPTSDPDNPSTPVRQYMGFLSRFLQEARITGQLEHPSIVPVYELGHRQDGTLYYTMKLVRGKTLREAIAQCKTIQERLALLAHFVDLCQAIAYAHSRGIVHRDIKPDNVMLGEFGETVVLDWGLAKAKDREDCHADGLAETIRMLQLGDVDSALKTQYGQVMGTPGYMSPEQALGKMSEVDEKSDVYSLGAVLYQTLAGRPPFTGKSVQEILRRVVDNEPDALGEDVAPPELAAICLKAMSKRADNRYASASAMADEVRRFQTGAIVQAYSYGFAGHVRRFAKKHKYSLAAGMLAAVVISLIARIAISNQQAKSMTENYLYTVSMDNAFKSLENDDKLQAAELVSSAPERLRGWEWGLLAALSHPQIRTLRYDFPGTANTIFSADGHLIAAGGAGGAVRVWDARNGAAPKKFSFGNNRVTQMCFSSDGSLLAVSTDGGWVKIWNVASGKTVLDIRSCEANIRGVDVDVQNKTIAIAATDGNCYIWDISTAKQTAVLRTGASTVHDVAFSPDSSLLATVDKAGHLRIWRSGSYKEVRSIKAHDGEAVVVSFDSEGHQVVTSGSDDSVKVWNAETLKLVNDFRNQWCGVFAPGGKQLLTNDTDIGSLVLWDISRGTKLEYSDRIPDVPRLSVDWGNREIVMPGSNGAIEILSLRCRSDEIALLGHDDSISWISFSPDSRMVATGAGGFDKAVIIWDSSSGRIIRKLHAIKGPVKSVAFLPDGKRLLASTGDGSVNLWSIRTAEILRTYKLKHNAHQIAIAADGKTMVSVGAGETSRQVWDVDTGKVLAESGGGELASNCVAFEPQGNYYAVGSFADGPQAPIVSVRDTQTSAEIAQLTATSGTVVDSVAFSPDGRYLAVDDIVLSVWDTRTWMRVATLSIAQGPMCFSRDGGRLVAQGQIWSTESWRPIMTITVDGSRILGYAVFSPDGSTLAMGNGPTGLLYRAFSWQPELFPGNDTMPLSDRLDLARRTRETADRKHNAELDQGPACLAQLKEIDAAALKWAETNGTGVGAAPPTPADLALVPMPSCPSGGDYRLTPVDGFSVCSIHGIPELDTDELIRAYDEAAAKSLHSAEVHKSRLMKALPLDWLELSELSRARLSDDRPAIHAAFAIAEYATSLAPDEGRVLGTLAHANYRLGRLDDAISTYRTVLSMGETSFSCGLALALLTRGTDADRTEARRLLDEAIEAGLDEKHFVDEVLQVLRDMTPAWNLDAWQDDSTRADLIRLAFFQGPDSIEHRLNPIPDEINSALAELENLAKGWNDLTSASGRAIRGIPEQGIVCDEPVSISKISFDKGDIIVTVGYQRVRSLEGLAAHVSEFVAAVRADRENTHRLEVSAVNAGGFTRHEIEFPGVVQQSVLFKRSQFALYCKIMANGTRQNIEDALEKREIDLSKTDAPPLSLEEGDIFVEWDGHKIENGKSLVEQFESHEQAAKDGTLLETVLTVRRPSTEKYIRQSIRLE